MAESAIIMPILQMRKQVCKDEVTDPKQLEAVLWELDARAWDSASMQYHLLPLGVTMSLLHLGPSSRLGEAGREVGPLGGGLVRSAFSSPTMYSCLSHQTCLLVCT